MIILIITRMVGCDLSYGPETGGNTSTVENFLPLYRTIKLHSLTSSTDYWVYLVCRDRQGGIHASHTVNFTTGIYSDIERGTHASHTVNFIINNQYLYKDIQGGINASHTVNLTTGMIYIQTIQYTRGIQANHTVNFA